MVAIGIVSLLLAGTFWLLAKGSLSPFHGAWMAGLSQALLLLLTRNFPLSFILCIVGGLFVAFAPRPQAGTIAPRSSSKT